MRAHTIRRMLSVAVFMFLAGSVIGAPQDSQDDFQSYGSRAKRHSEGAGAPEIVPHRKNAHKSAAPTAGSTGYMTPDIQNVNNGPVMYQPNVYVIWYGNWKKTSGSDTASGQQIIARFPPWTQRVSVLHDQHHLRWREWFFSVLGEYVDGYSQTSNLSDSRVQAVVSHAISVKALPKDSNGIYFVLTSSDVAESSGFCRQYCGWHTAGTISANRHQVCVCRQRQPLHQRVRCPNGWAERQCWCRRDDLGHCTRIGGDQHGPDLNAWFDSKGAEDADKCAWTFGANQKKASNGAYYNMTLPGVTGNQRNYLVQRELKSNSKCYVNYNRTQ